MVEVALPLKWLACWHWFWNEIHTIFKVSIIYFTSRSVYSWRITKGHQTVAQFIFSHTFAHNSPFFLDELSGWLLRLTPLRTPDTSGDLSGFFPSRVVAALDESIPIGAGALTGKEEIFQSAGHVVVMTPACADHWICPRASYKWILWPFADMDIYNK